MGRDLADLRKNVENLQITQEGSILKVANPRDAFTISLSQYFELDRSFSLRSSEVGKKYLEQIKKSKNIDENKRLQKKMSEEFDLIEKERNKLDEKLKPISYSFFCLEFIFQSSFFGSLTKVDLDKYLILFKSKQMTQNEFRKSLSHAGYITGRTEFFDYIKDQVKKGFIVKETNKHSRRGRPSPVLKLNEKKFQEVWGSKHYPLDVYMTAFALLDKSNPEIKDPVFRIPKNWKIEIEMPKEK